MNLSAIETDVCPFCGKAHHCGIESVHIGKGALQALPQELKRMGAKKAFLLADQNTYPLAGARIGEMLKENGIGMSQYIFPLSRIEPDERAVGSAVMHFDNSCDTVIALGSGVINDIGKILSATRKTRYIIIATAPSMDGYASATSSMAMDGLKVSLPSRSAQVIIGDTDLVKTAPMEMLKAGLGDMLAKYVSICEWKIANLILGEYYCDTISKLVQDSLQKCVDNADGLLSRKDEAVEAVLEGLVITGIAMNLAGVSRPASGVEHYLSHVWDMRALEFGMEADLHGLQCAAGTYIASTIYHKLLAATPDREKALASVKAFSYEKHKKELRTLLGKGAEAMIALEEKEGKYDPEKHKARLEVILEKWDQICHLIQAHIPSPEKLQALYDKLNLPKKSEDPTPLTTVFRASADIRDKYVLSRLVWDLGLQDEMNKELEKM